MSHITDTETCLQAINRAAKEARKVQPRKRFHRLLEEIPDNVLGPISAAWSRQLESHNVCLMYVTLAARALLYGAPEGEFEAKDEDLCAWTRVVGACCSLTLMGRIGAFRVVRIPRNPFIDDAELEWRDPNPVFAQMAEQWERRQLKVVEN